MLTKWFRPMHVGGLGINLIGLGLLGGILAAQVWSNYQRTARLQGQEAAGGSWRTLVVHEKPGESSGKPSDDLWTPHIRRMEEALAHKNVSAAELAWHDAYGETLRSRSWEGLVAVGNASLQIGKVVGARQVPEAKARQLYLAALFRARDQGSLDGVLRTAEAFAAMGDREVAMRAVYVAEGLATRSREAEASFRVRAFEERLAARFFEAKNAAFDPF